MKKRFSPSNFATFVIMPNHVHGIIHIVRGVGEEFEKPESGNHLPGTGVRVGFEKSESEHLLPDTGVGEGFDHPVDAIQPLRPYITTGSLGAIVRAYKASVAFRINSIRGYAKPPIWHRNYYEHIIRNEKEYQRIMGYIESNPANWWEDRFYVPD